MKFEELSTEDEAVVGEEDSVESERLEANRLEEFTNKEVEAIGETIDEAEKSPDTLLKKMGRTGLGRYIVAGFVALTTMASMAPEAEASGIDLGKSTERVFRRAQRDAEREANRRIKDILAGKKENKKPKKSEKETAVEELERQLVVLQKNREKVGRRIATLEKALLRAKTDRQIEAVEKRLQEADAEKKSLDTEIQTVLDEIEAVKTGRPVNKKEAEKTGGKTSSNSDAKPGSDSER